MKIKKNNFQSGNSNHYNVEDEMDNYEEPKQWYEEIQEDPKSFSKSTEQVLIELKDEAKKCHDSEVLHYNTKNSKTNSDFQWMKTVMSKGTLSDKIAAHTVMIQDNPVACLDTIRNLVGMVKVGKKKECTTVMETLTELFLSNLLIPNRKLKAFHQRPLSALNELSSGNAVSRRKILSYWYFEDQLKEIYATFVVALNAVAHDTVDSNKDKAVTALYKLLVDNSEQEKNLLTYIINKLGDPSQKIASKVIYCLTQLLYKHVNMQLVVLNEIEKLLFRPNISTRAQYYSLCFLSQFHLSHETSHIARKLIEVYFSFFKACVKTGDIDSRMMSALLMGLNRAYPYAKLEYDKVQEHVDTMYRLVHMANFNISLHTLTLLYQVSDTGTGVTDRFYGALYRKLLDPSLLTTTHRAMLLSLIYKALLKDKEINRIKMFVKRLLQIALFTQPCFSCGILFLVSQLMNKKKDLQALTLKQSAPISFEDDDDEEKYQDVKEENEEIPEIKEEVDDEEFKKLEQNQSTPSINAMVETIEIKEEDEDIKPDVEILNASLNNSAGWYHCKNTVKKEKGAVIKYNPLSRNPLYGGGEFCAYTELYNLKNHFHPTVALFASNIINGETVAYNGDPLNDFTLIRFLERFVFKNPKRVSEASGRDSTFGKRKLYRPKGVKAMSVKTASYAKESSENIPVDELFVHTYLQQRYQERGETERDDSDLESVQSDEFEEMLDKLSGRKDGEEEDEEDVDYLNEIGENLRQKDSKKKKKQKSEDDEDDSDDISEEDDDDMDDFDGEFDNADLDDEDLDMNDDDKELLGDLSDEEDDEAIDFSDEEEQPGKNKFKKFAKKKGDIMSNFASAEEFATLLEDEGSSKFKPGGSNAFANKDNANVKQLAWEENRNRWLNNFSRTMGGGKGKKFNKSNNNKNFSKKRSNHNKGGNQNKKIKR
ncbi:CCAAT/enhancer-binding protein zeta [Diabrotica virgifera virgifera]|uniref:CCAAT-binding factor domain-containing protein n=1 Tax=Diabrotica virgifera virgifera TaxID=50390 RepID=A0ABM5K8N3_DIAVI|nr:CCAAT/enhancer-binding protein zeta [Diabrotica virgifera virgifera]